MARPGVCRGIRPQRSLFRRPEGLQAAATLTQTEGAAAPRSVALIRQERETVAFRVYRRVKSDQAVTFENTGELFKLAGYNLLFEAWKEAGEPTDEGWSASADDLIRIQSDGEHSSQTMRLVFDYNPTAKRQVGLVELTAIRAYMFAYGSDEVVWSILMLAMRSVLWEELDHDVTKEERARLIERYTEPEEPKECVEFLYLRDNWNFGPSGMVNAAMIEEEPRAYFRKFF